jgi:SAM-dependent methyltransferase
MKKWENINIDTSRLIELEEIVKNKENFNPSCNLISYWSDRINHHIKEEAVKMNKLGYGYVGDGWPQKMNQEWALANDKRGLKEAFTSHHHRDVGDAIYQCNTILDNSKFEEKLRIVDFGGGYGRLSIPFIHHMKGNVTYFSVEYVPISLLIAPQFVTQAVDAKTTGWYEDVEKYEDYDFVSLPSWKVSNIKDSTINVFVTIHSFQEMTDEAVKFYVSEINRMAAPKAIFYSVNLPTKGNKNIVIPSSWKLISEKAYPINRDGNFFERIWEIR